jgi:hypothetical protein
MFYVTVGDERYSVAFQRTNNTRHSTFRVETICSISRLFKANDGTEIASTESVGSAICAPSDNFCKDTGRKVALKKALYEFPYDPEAADSVVFRKIRALFWQEYFRSRGKEVPQFNG